MYVISRYLLQRPAVLVSLLVVFCFGFYYATRPAPPPPVHYNPWGTQAQMAAASATSADSAASGA